MMSCAAKRAFSGRLKYRRISDRSCCTCASGNPDLGGPVSLRNVDLISPFTRATGADIDEYPGLAAISQVGSCSFHGACVIIASTPINTTASDCSKTLLSITLGLNKPRNTPAHL